MTPIAPLAALIAAFASAGRAEPSPPRSSFKVAFYNIQSGHGERPLPGRSCGFEEQANCDASASGRPLNAWGRGVVQRALAAVSNDPALVALGLAESWAKVCGSPAAVREALGWKDATAERNGVALVTRYGLAAAPEWRQLDTSRNPNPKDTMWVMRAEACLVQNCGARIPLFVAHWFANGENAAEVYAAQAAQTVAFLERDGDSMPRVLIGDLNVWEGEPRCGQRPNGAPLEKLRTAGYTDAWRAVHGRAEGFTGMWNRPGCGTPEGSLWKRVDYAWSKGLAPRAMARFGLVTPGACAPSDHAGIVVEYGAH